MVSVVIWRCEWGKISLGQVGNHQVSWKKYEEFFALKIHTGSFNENKHMKGSGVRFGQERKKLYKLLSQNFKKRRHL
jgi:hypothetical protein